MKIATAALLAAFSFLPSIDAQAADPAQAAADIATAALEDLADHDRAQWADKAAASTIRWISITAPPDANSTELDRDSLELDGMVLRGWFRDRFDPPKAGVGFEDLTVLMSYVEHDCAKRTLKATRLVAIGADGRVINDAPRHHPAEKPLPESRGENTHLHVCALRDRLTTSR